MTTKGKFILDHIRMSSSRYTSAVYIGAIAIADCRGFGTRNTKLICIGFTRTTAWLQLLHLMGLQQFLHQYQSKSKTSSSSILRELLRTAKRARRSSRAIYVLIKKKTQYLVTFTHRTRKRRFAPAKEGGWDDDATTPTRSCGGSTYMY